jgi:16S rRNA (cytosine967-C5)-methyltransferase
MRMAGRAQAAIEILIEVFERHRPVAEALKDWGKAHRFAGSTDRHAIGTLVYDALRKRNSLSARMGDGRPRALVLGVLRDLWDMAPADIGTLVAEQHGPGALSDKEMAALERQARTDLPVHVAGDFPEWLAPSFVRVFGDHAAEEAAALSQRAPTDLRTNALKAERPQVMEALSRFGAVEGPLSPYAVRIPAPGGFTRNANVEAETSHGMGWFEVQDAGSQAAALLSGAKAGERVLDLCAGAGGKTLALAAMMKNEGTLIAHDADKHRLRPIFERLTRAGAFMVQVMGAEQGGKLGQDFDCVLIDAPCSGSGAWRRKPDSKWRFTEKHLRDRIKAQNEVIEKASKLTAPGGRLIYITCSVLPEENGDQVSTFLAAHPNFEIVPYADHWRQAIGGEPPHSADDSKETLLLTPRQHETDGFFIAVMRRRS